MGDFVDFHMRQSMYDSSKASQSNQKQANKLWAKIKLRLCIMSDTELWMLSQRLAPVEKKSSTEVHLSLLKQIKELQETAPVWVKYLGV
jgi:hypothetical protein